jgi:hypothetical protein
MSLGSAFRNAPSKKRLTVISDVSVEAPLDLEVLKKELSTKKNIVIISREGKGRNAIRYNLVKKLGEFRLF